MLHGLILKVSKFQLPPPKRLSTVVKNIFFLGGGLSCPRCRIGLSQLKQDVAWYVLLWLMKTSTNNERKCNILKEPTEKDPEKDRHEDK